MGEARHVAEEFVEAFNAHDEARLHSLDREDVVFEAPGDIKLTGTDATTDYAMAWIRAFPDARMTVHNTVAAEGWAVAGVHLRGDARGHAQRSRRRDPGNAPPPERSRRPDHEGGGRQDRRSAPVLRPGRRADAAGRDARRGRRNRLRWEQGGAAHAAPPRVRCCSRRRQGSCGREADAFRDVPPPEAGDPSGGIRSCGFRLADQCRGEDSNL